MNCKEASHLISDGLDRRLGLAERFRLRAHLLICHYCSAFFRQTRFMRRAARLAASRPKPPQE
ncbi:zf-HC2 domain-containing protein [Chitinimonas koreensis]|uniref:zf-HC2 domain-containing protein n=1 Tax=Chitinimonas koreensis TaxID=356302 RepID=UPI00042919EC|nr:zf-HC2 domain-containing protein [Chitinimonas koreensis]QNM97084.1 zf-HC2 domain-containing protein [Chitinimonas koreensis]